MRHRLQLRHAEQDQFIVTIQATRGRYRGRLKHTKASETNQRAATSTEPPA
jgi:hypothetical protein